MEKRRKREKIELLIKMNVDARALKQKRTFFDAGVYTYERNRHSTVSIYKQENAFKAHQQLSLLVAVPHNSS